MGIEHRDVPAFPKIALISRDDGTGEATVSGRSTSVSGENSDEVRGLLLGITTDVAGKLGRPVKATTFGVDGEWDLVVHPDGTVEEDTSAPVTKKTRKDKSRRVRSGAGAPQERTAPGLVPPIIASPVESESPAPPVEVPATSPEPVSGAERVEPAASPLVGTGALGPGVDLGAGPGLEVDREIEPVADSAPAPHTVSSGETEVASADEPPVPVPGSEPGPAQAHTAPPRRVGPPPGGMPNPYGSQRLRNGESLTGASWGGWQKTGPEAPGSENWSRAAQWWSQAITEHNQAVDERRRAAVSPLPHGEAEREENPAESRSGFVPHWPNKG